MLFEKLFFYAYNFLALYLFSLILPVYAVSELFHGRSCSVLKQRLGIYPASLLGKKTGYPTIWIHAASVGEVKVACRVIHDLMIKFKGVAFVLSTTTVGGNDYAKELVRDKATVVFAPLDLCFCVRFALLKMNPSILVFIETEIWPNWITIAHQFQITTMFLNGRISKRSVRGYRIIKTLMKFVLDKVDVFSMASYGDKSRIMSIGAPVARVFMNGNAKFDFRKSDCGTDTIKRMHRLYNLADNPPVFVAGSVRGSEEHLVIDAYVKIRRSFPETVLIIAPRHLNKVSGLEKRITQRGLSVVRRSSLDSALFRKASVIILDTIGELMASYSVATVVFCGASLVRLGGQNILEAAVWAKPVIHGLFMDDFRDAVDLLQKSEASIQVKSGEQLAEAVIYLLGNLNYANQVGTLARRTILLNRGAIAKHTKIIGDFIDGHA